MSSNCHLILCASLIYSNFCTCSHLLLKHSTFCNSLWYIYLFNLRLYTIAIVYFVYKKGLPVELNLEFRLDKVNIERFVISSIITIVCSVVPFSNTILLQKQDTTNGDEDYFEPHATVSRRSG